MPTGWVKFDPTGAGLFMQLDTTFGIPFVPANGHQSFGFGGNSITSGTLSQTFDTVVGATYAVNYQYLIQQGLEPEALFVDVHNGPPLLASTFFIFSNTNWVSAPVLMFTATGTSTTLRFGDDTGALLPGTGASTNWALDAVTVTQTAVPGPAGVPEPGSFAPVGLAGLAAAVWRLRKRATPGQSA